MGYLTSFSCRGPFTTPHSPAVIRVVLGCVLAIAAACGGGGNSSPTAPSSQTPSVRSISVAGYSAPLSGVGATVSLKATAMMSNGASQDVTATATWVSDVTGVATVDGAGVVTARSAGDATISATHGGAVGTMRIKVDLPREMKPALTGNLQVTRSPEPAYWFRSTVNTTFSETGGGVGYSVNYINVAWYDYQDKLLLFHNYNPGELARIWGTNYVRAGGAQTIRTWIDYTRTLSRTTARVEISVTDDFGNSRTYNGTFSDAVDSTAPAGLRPTDAAGSGGTEGLP